MLLWSSFLLLAATLFGNTLSQGPAIVVKAVLNETASLPCNVIPPTSSDSVILVVWYRNELKPIYSLDSRDGFFRTATHWREKTGLGERLNFKTDSSPTVLTISNVQEADEGYYRCRVDFMKSPTRNSKVNLTLIVPPQKPVILDKTGHSINLIAGPYIEGSDARLTCKVLGGKPKPEIKWRASTMNLETNEISIMDSNMKLMEVIVQNLNRSHLNQSLVCEASNNNIEAPLSTVVYLDIYLKPFNVTIVESNQPLSVDREYKIICLALGSRPHASITWWLNHTPLIEFTEEKSENLTNSTLTFAPSMNDHNKTLVCRCENPKIPGEFMEASSIIDVMFPPVLELSFGPQVNPDDIEEGDDVYFECKVLANPAAYKLEWMHNGILVQHNTKNGVIISSNTLVLQKIKRQVAGNYSCAASSVEGDGKSNYVQLRVMYKPVCKPNQKYVYGVAKEENAQVVCEVDGFPSPNSFIWLFNHTNKPIPEARYSSADNRKAISVLTFSPQSESDYGILMCSAINTVGQQKEPCVFHIIPAGLPEPPYNCTVNNQTSDSIEIHCMEGFDNGQSQYFVAEVVDQDTDMLVTNMSSSKLSFKIGRLSPGKSLRMSVYAVNTRGRSEAVVFETFTLESAQKHTGDPSSLTTTPVIAALLGLAAISFILGAVALCALRGRRIRRSHQRYTDPHSSLADKTKCISDLDSGGGVAGGGGYEIEKTPDVVQCNNKGVDFRATRSDECSLNSVAPSIRPSVEIDQSTTKPSSLEDILAPNHVISEHLIPSLSGDSKYQNASISLVPNDSCKVLQNSKNYSSPFLDRTRYSSSPAAECTVTSIAPYHREVITVRTPLPHNDQESCV